MFDPEIRDYILYFFLQDLRQLYFNSGKTYGTPLGIICQRIRAVLKNRGWTDELLNRFRVDESMMQSIAKELLEEQYIYLFVKEKKKGTIFKKTVKTTYYQIVQKGLDYIKGKHAPASPLRNIGNK